MLSDPVALLELMDSSSRWTSVTDTARSAVSALASGCGLADQKSILEVKETASYIYRGGGRRIHWSPSKTAGVQTFNIPVIHVVRYAPGLLTSRNKTTSVDLISRHIRRQTPIEW